MVKQKSHNTFSIQGRVVGVPSVRMSRQGDGGYVDITLNVMEEMWDPQAQAYLPNTTKVPLSYYSKVPQEDSQRLKPGYAVIVDGHVRGRSYTDGQGGQRLAADLRVDNVDVIEPFLSKDAHATPASRGTGRPSMQAGYQEQATIAEQQKQTTEKTPSKVAPAPYNGPAQTVEQFDDDDIPF